MAKYRKKPIEVEAVEIINVLGDQEECEVWGSQDAGWFKDGLERGVGEVGGIWVLHNTLCIGTLEGTMRANIGDFIVRGIENEIYPVKGSVFRKTYEASDK